MKEPCRQPLSGKLTARFSASKYVNFFPARMHCFLAAKEHSASIERLAALSNTAKKDIECFTNQYRLLLMNIELVDKRINSF